MSPFDSRYMRMKNDKTSYWYRSPECPAATKCSLEDSMYHLHHGFHVYCASASFAYTVVQKKHTPAGLETHYYFAVVMNAWVTFFPFGELNM